MCHLAGTAAPVTPEGARLCMIQSQQVPGSQDHPVATPLLVKPYMGRKCGKLAIFGQRTQKVK